MTMDITEAETAAPSDVDKAIAELDYQGGRIAGGIAQARRELKSRYLTADRAAALEVQISDATMQLQDISDQANALEAVWSARGHWSRAFIVAGGHVHRSMSCSSCYPSTRFGWLTELSGMAESEIVELAGERACTVCYPSAPVDVLQRASKLFHAEELEAAERRAVLQARKVELAAKREASRLELTVFDAYGRPERLHTVTAVKSYLTDAFDTSWSHSRPAKRHLEFAAQALADKLGTTMAGELEAARVRGSKRK